MLLLLPLFWFSCSLSLRRYRLARIHFHWRQPAKPVRLQPVSDAEELVRDLLRNLAGFAVANHDAINGPDRLHLRGRSRKEHLVGDVQELPRNRLLGHRESQVPRNRQHAVARNSRQRRVRPAAA